MVNAAGGLLRETFSWRWHNAWSGVPLRGGQPRDTEGGRPRDIEAIVPHARLQRTDGWGVTHEMPMDHWCVTREDLKKLRVAVHNAVADGHIIPSELDPFDPSDDRYGPCVHTVVQQMIKPVTYAAGGCSWALMYHPKGLKCDLFVTHGWAEGIYEFIDKVLHSWPRKAKHAYCCM